MSAYKETKLHGSRSFPYTVYRVELPEFFNSFPLHWHDEVEIIFVSEGIINVMLESEEFSVRQGEIVLIHPQTIHAIKQHGDNRAVYFNILFRFALLEGNRDDVCRSKFFEPIYNRELIMPELVFSEHPLNTLLAPLIKTLISIIPRHYSGNELLIKSRVFEIMHHIKQHCSAAEDGDLKKESFYEKLKASLAYLEENYAENISVADAAAMSNFSESYFSKLFVRLTGSSFNKYLKNFRLERAAEKIRAGNVKISEAAISCGFGNLSYFTRAFREKYGVTPKAFQKEQKLRLDIHPR